MLQLFYTSEVLKYLGSYESFSIKASHKQKIIVVSS